MQTLARLVTGYPRPILIGCLLLVLVAGAYGRNAPSQLSPAGYEVSGSESTQASRLLADHFDTGPANLVLLATTQLPGGVDSRAATRDGLELERRLAAVADVADVTSYWTTGADQLAGVDRSQALIIARVVVGEEEVYGRVEAIRAEFAGPFETLKIEVGGSGAMNLEVVEESERDLLRAELIAIPITTIIMLLVFRSVVAALLPLVVAAVAVAGTAAALKGLSELTLVSVFALNLTTALGLGMGVDYSLFLLARWREERAAGASATLAVERSVVMAGRPIVFSGMTTAATLAALLVFDYPLLRSLALAGFVVVILAAFGALVALPAAMTLLGDRVDRWQIRQPTTRLVDDGGWFRIAYAIMRRPVLTLVVGVSILLLVGSPFLRARFGIPDDRALPPASPARQVADDLRANFDAREFGALAVVSPAWSGPQTDDAVDEEVDEEVDEGVDDYAKSLSEIEGIERVEVDAGVYRDGVRVADGLQPSRFRSDEGRWFSAIPAVEPISPEAEELVAGIRALSPPHPVFVGGESARLVDNKAEIARKLPFVFLWVIVAVGVLLFASFRSVLIPIKALLLNLLSLTASFGAIVWIFQDGRLSGILGFTPTGLIDAQTPVLIFCIAFGLSMDYEVFLLSRIKEEWDATGDPQRSVAVGLQRTGGIITAAAVLMAVVFLAFASGNVTFIQMVGIGLALAIVMDAAVVRTFLVPAFMVLAGRWNWWAPSWRRRSMLVGLDERPATERSRL